MNNHLLLTVILALTAACHAFAGDETALRTHLFILSGQSNMVGLDPDTSFTPTVSKALAADRIIVVKDAEGGKPIRLWYKEWKPTTGDRPRGTGELYDRLMSKVRRAIEGEKVDTATFVWMQGERDAREEHGDLYAESFRGLVAQLEKDLCRSDIFVVIGRLSDYGLDDPERPHWTTVRETQVALATEHPRWAWVNTDDLNGPDNRLHYTREGYHILGARFAEAAVKLITAADGTATNLSAN